MAYITYLLVCYTHVHGFLTYSEGTTSYSWDRIFLQTFLGEYLKQRLPIRTLLMTPEMHVWPWQTFVSVVTVNTRFTTVWFQFNYTATANYDYNIDFFFFASANVTFFSYLRAILFFTRQLHELRILLHFTWCFIKISKCQLEYEV